MVDTKLVDAKATTLLREVFGDIDTIKLPVDLNEIARHCRLTIQQGSFADQDLEGALNRSNRTVYLSADDEYSRKNFTLAHEIGHLKLHEDVKTELFFMHQLTDLMNTQQDEKEAAADEFAAALLVPEPSLKSLWEVNKNIGSLAQIFGVPSVVMRYRIKNLRLKK